MSPFAIYTRAREEDAYVRDAVDFHTGLYLAQQRLITAFGTILAFLNALLVAGAGAIALTLWVDGVPRECAVAHREMVAVVGQRRRWHREVLLDRRPHRALGELARHPNRLEQQPSLDEAVGWMKRAPFGPGDEIEIRQVFAAEDFGEALTPELREQEERLRAQAGKQ